MGEIFCVEFQITPLKLHTKYVTYILKDPVFIQRWSHSETLIIIFPQAEWRVEETQPPQEWPQKGAVKFSSYGTRYREGLDLVVKDIDINIKGGEKVHIHPQIIVFKTIISYSCEKNE